jgi:phosphomannomutase/phosphoglucomutase
VKYDVVARVTSRFEEKLKAGESMAGSPIVSLNTVNGVRVLTEDGSWGLVRASSNKPELVVVVESPVSAEKMRRVFEEIDAVLRQCGTVGAYNQSL